jgi:hypothetical protein
MKDYSFEGFNGLARKHWSGFALAIFRWLGPAYRLPAAFWPKIPVILAIMQTSVALARYSGYVMR